MSLKKGKPNKICILSSAHQAMDPRIYYKEAITLKNAGYDVTLIASHDKDDCVEDIQIISIVKANTRIRRVFNTWKIFRLALSNKARIYHFHDPELLPIGLLLKILNNSKIIFDIHEYYSQTILFKKWIPELIRTTVAHSYGMVEILFIKTISAVIVVTEPMRNKYSKYINKCVLVRNFPDIRLRDTTQSEVTPDYTTNCQSIIYTGRVTKHKGFLTILNAMKLVVQEIPTAVCTILACKEDAGWLSSEDKHIMEQLYSNGNLKFIGRVIHHDVYNKINSATIGWKPGPYYQEGISTKTIEYMACGIPVVVSDFPITSEIIRENKCGIAVDPDDSSEHASAIIYLLSHPDEARKMGENGMRSVEEKYNWELEGEKLLELYRKLLN